jgi:hypothetical protein
VNISGTEVTTSQFLEILTTALLEINSGKNDLILLKTFNNPSGPIDSIRSGNIFRAEYLKIAGDVKGYMDSSGKTPDFAYGTSLGTCLGFQNLVYMYSMILDYHKTSGKMADFAMMEPWSVITSKPFVDPNAPKFTLDQIKNTASTVRNYIETYHKLPGNVVIGSNQISMSQFLELAVTATIEINTGSSDLIVLRSFAESSNPVDSIRSGNIFRAEYLKIAGDVKGYMDSSGKTPDFAYGTSLGTCLGFQNLVYMYSMILDYHKTSGKMADFAMMEPWSNI